MSAKSESNIKYPYEYIAAQVEFGVKVVEITGQKATLVFNKYTNLYGTLSNHRFADNGEFAWVKPVLTELDKLVTEMSDPVKLAEAIYKLYLWIPLEKPHVHANENLHFGCFRLNNSKYYQTRKEVRLHFSPTREGISANDPTMRASDLAPVYMSKRYEEFKQMIKYIFDNPELFGGATHFVSSSWLQNLSTYRSFFPEIAENNKTKVEHGHWWYWGQFLKWDLSGNAERLKELQNNLKAAKSFEEATDAIPLQIYEVKVPLEEMFAKYL
jgi:hypothetical protein